MYKNGMDYGLLIAVCTYIYNIRSTQDNVGGFPLWAAAALMAIRLKLTE